MILFNHASSYNIIGSVWSRTSTGGWLPVGAITTSVDLTQFSMARVITSNLVAYSNTISTTNTVLSGAMTTMKLFQVPLISPTWNNIAQYIGAPNTYAMNGDLARGTVSVSMP
jgi:hypothetical protein